MRQGPAWAMGQIASSLQDQPALFEAYLERVNRLHTIREIDMHEETVTGADKNIDVVVELFNRVNTGGTKLSKGDLALAKLCASWPQARQNRVRGSLSGRPGGAWQLLDPAPCWPR